LSISDSPDIPDARLLDPEIQEFIRTHVSSDIHELSLRQPPQKFGIPFRDIAVQIAGLQKARRKLPQYFSTQGILYPPPASLEQCSSETTAMFKARQAAVFSSPSNARCVDLSGGFGVDTFFLSHHYEEVHYVEPDRELLQLARHNHRRLGALNIVYHDKDALTYLNETALAFDLAYVDPSRRTESRQRKIELTAYSPDVRTLIPFLGKAYNRMMLKASPMLDIDRGLQVIPHVARVDVVAVGGEVKELLFFSEADYSADPLLEAIDLSADRAPFIFYRKQESDAVVQHSAPQRYVYEPAPEILKAGAFRLIASRYGLAKLHVNTHLYTSGTRLEDFPGRAYEIIATARRYTPELAAMFDEGMANVVVRNYPLTADQLRSRAGLKEGGERYLLAFTSPDGPMLAAATLLR
jgi:hypothetical protein